MFLILEWSEYDSQSSRKAWEVVYPYKENGYETRKEADDAADLITRGGRTLRIVEVK